MCSTMTCCKITIHIFIWGPGGSMSQLVGLPNNSYKPITNMAWVRTWLCKLQKGCSQLTIASDKASQLLAHGRWFSPGTPVSSTTKTGCHDIAEILLRVALNTTNQIISNHIFICSLIMFLYCLMVQLLNYENLFVWPINLFVWPINLD